MKLMAIRKKGIFCSIVTIIMIVSVGTVVVSASDSEITSDIIGGYRGDGDGIGGYIPDYFKEHGIDTDSGTSASINATAQYYLTFSLSTAETSKVTSEVSISNLSTLSLSISKGISRLPAAIR